MSFKNSDKDRLKKDLFDILINIKDVVSVTLVGSFWIKNNLNNFSDIDVVIILKKFNKTKYQECLNTISEIDLTKYNLGHLNLLINPTFGPLKFDDNNKLVFHTMIYDIKSHIDHVIKSPFTCYDWERSLNYKGKSLKDIFPVGTIQLVDFVRSRRGATDYVTNLKKNYISYQKYEFKKKKYILKNKKFKINERHRIEFSYHLCKFLIINFYKFEKQKNAVPNDKEIRLVFKKIFNKKYTYYLKNLNHLLSLKKQKNINNKFPSFVFVKKFIKNFQNFLHKYNKQEVIFLRHAKTKLNDGTFLGIGRDPGIINKNKVRDNLKFLNKKKIKIIYSSSLKRSFETAKLINKKNNILISNYLVEKNYGKAEGLNFKSLKKKYPSIIVKWYEKKDPKFPSGESDTDILKRINLFKKKLITHIKKNKKKGVIVIVTHNALLRCFIGESFLIPKHMWVKINIKHIKPLHFILKKNEIIPNLYRTDLFKNLIN